MKTEANLLRFLLLACLVLQVSFYVLAWSALLPASLFMQMSVRDLSEAALRALTPAQSVAGATVGLPALLAVAYGLWRLNCALNNIGRRAIFTLDTIGHVRAFACAMLASTGLAILEVPLRSALFHYVFALPGEKLRIGVSGDQVLLTLVCALFYLITRMMHEGRRLAEENEGFI